MGWMQGTLVDSLQRCGSQVWGRKVFCNPVISSQPFSEVLTLGFTCVSQVLSPPPVGQNGCSWPELDISLPLNQAGSDNTPWGRLLSLPPPEATWKGMTRAYEFNPVSKFYRFQSFHNINTC